jgi:hypothetical protein
MKRHLDGYLASRKDRGLGSCAYDWALEIAKKPGDQEGFVVHAEHGIVNRKIASLVKCRRRVKDSDIWSRPAKP